MKKIMFVAGCVLLTVLVNTTPSFAWGPPGHWGPPPPPYRPYGYHHHHSHAGEVIGGVILGGLVLGGIAAAMNPPPVQYVAQPVYVAPPPQVVVQQPQTCVEERKVSGEYQLQPNGTQVWVTYPYPVVRRYEVPCN